MLKMNLITQKELWGELYGEVDGELYGEVWRELYGEVNWEVGWEVYQPLGLQIRTKFSHSKISRV